MPLDLHVESEGEVFHFKMSEGFHSSIFSNTVRWRSYRLLRKIKDYYRADCYFSGDDAKNFLAELEEVCLVLSLKSDEINIIKKAIHQKRVESLRITSD